MGRTTRNRTLGPARPDSVRQGMQGEPCSIVFGHNAEIGRVMMMFSVAADRLVFTPDEAEDVAAKLQYYARAARGEAVA